MDKKSNIRVILKNAGELLIGELVKETKDYIEFKDLAFVVIGKGSANNQVSVQFIPLEMVAVQPQPVPLKAILENPDDEITLKVYKDQILNDNVVIKNQIIENYESARNPSPILTPSSKIITPDDVKDEKVIKLFDS